MTLQDFNEIAAYWNRHPPAHILIAGYVGYKSPDRAKQNDMEELVRVFGPPQ